jgi:hypothetical protein
MGTVTSVALESTKELVKDHQRNMGFKSFSGTLRHIIKEYFEIKRQINSVQDNDLEKLSNLITGGNNSEFTTTIIEDLIELKQAVSEVRNMLVLIAHNDDDLQELFIQYFPKYFKISK